ncbi:MAG TPA: peptide chain release factor N(5)-glutamine methyltransferase [Ktedonobacteraceae bacterium]|nr:peptide chain release factor N(5)-glutamine methyltransferase [Ktedonobacteraceae bacterium]
MTTIQQALALDITYDIDRIDAQILLAYVLHVERSTLYAYPERELTPEEEQQYLALIERRAHDEPVAYLVGHKEFYGLDFLVDRRVLIPRPETELLVETALLVCRQKIEAGYVPIVADIGTGSGAIPIALAVNEPRLPYLYAIDISSDALAVAALNCQRHHVEQRVRLLQGDLIAPLPEPVDMLTANLPYVGTNETTLLTPDVYDYEPHLALFSGPDGLDLMERFLKDVAESSKLKVDAVILLEIGYQQRERLSQVVYKLWPLSKIRVYKDYAGWDRVLQVHLKGENRAALEIQTRGG